MTSPRLWRSAGACKRGGTRSRARAVHSWRTAARFTACARNGSRATTRSIPAGVSSFADRGGNTHLAAELCPAADPRRQAGCYAGLGVVVGLLQPTNQDRTKACRSLSQTYARECAKAAIAEVEPGGRGAWG